MTLANPQSAPAADRARSSLFPLLFFPILLFAVLPAWSAGTAAGTVIDNVASVNFDLGGVNITQVSNTTTVTVVERIDVVVTLQSGQVLVAASDTDRSLLFTVTNTGNGTEAGADGGAAQQKEFIAKDVLDTL